MRKFLESLAALGIGILFSVALLCVLEVGLRLNKSFGWIKIHPASATIDEESRRLQEDWQGVDRKFLAEIPDHFRAVNEKYGDRVDSAPTALIYLPTSLPDKSYQFKKYAPDGEPIFDVHYRYNEKERRPTPGQPKLARESIFLVGCSYTVGEGVSENETFAAYMQPSLKNTAVETLAFHGWGVNNHLNALRGELTAKDRPNPYKVLENKPVTVVYPFIPDHIYRTTCPLFCYQKDYQWMLGFPDYEINDQKEARYLGSFSESRSFSFFFRWVANSAIVTQLGLNWIYRGGDDALKKYFDVLDAYRHELGKRVPIKDFYFVPIEPYFPFGEKVSAMALERGYKVLDLGKLALPKMIGKNPRIPFDGHFAPPVNYLLSRLMLSRIQKDHPEIR